MRFPTGLAEVTGLPRPPANLQAFPTGRQDQARLEGVVQAVEALVAVVEEAEAGEDVNLALT